MNKRHDGGYKINHPLFWLLSHWGLQLLELTELSDLQDIWTCLHVQASWRKWVTSVLNFEVLAPHVLTVGPFDVLD